MTSPFRATFARERSMMMQCTRSIKENKSDHNLPHRWTESRMDQLGIKCQ